MNSPARKKSWFSVAAASLLSAAALSAQLPKPEQVVEVRLEPAAVEARKGRAAATLVAEIREGFHINSSKPTKEYLIPSRIELLAPAGDKPGAASPAFALESAAFPAGALKSFSFAPDDKLSVYEGTVKVPLKLRAPAGLAPGEHTVRLAFHYQACNDSVCLRPAKREAALSVRVATQARFRPARVRIPIAPRTIPGPTPPTAPPAPRP